MLMLMDNGYYYINLPYYDGIDGAPPGQLLFVISAGHHKLLTLDFFDSVHIDRADYQFLYVKKGKLYYIEDGKEAIAEENSFVLYKPFEYQRYKYFLKDNADIYWVHFSGSTAAMVLQSNGLLNQRVFKVGDSPIFSELFTHLIYNLKNQDDFSVKLNVSYLNALFSEIARTQAKNNSEEKTPDELLRAIRYIDDHLSEKITLADIAKNSNISTKTLTRYFEKHQKMSPIKYVNYTRIEKAKTLLQSNNSISQIASVLGFDDPLYFSTVFRRFVGLSPEKYRKSLINAIEQQKNISGTDIV